MRSHVSIALMLLSLIPTISAQTREATVEIRATDSLGGLMRKVEAHLYSANGKQIAEAAGESPLTVHVPYGEYRLLVLSAGSKRSESMVKVDSDRVVVALGLVPRFGDTVRETDGFSISGMVDGLPREHSGAQIRLVGLHINIVIDTDLEPTGKFEFKDLDLGSYAVLVTMENELIGSAAVVVEPSHPHVQIRIPWRRQN